MKNGTEKKEETSLLTLPKLMVSEKCYVERVQSGRIKLIAIAKGNKILEKTLVEPIAEGDYETRETLHFRIAAKTTKTAKEIETLESGETREHDLIDSSFTASIPLTAMRLFGGEALSPSQIVERYDENIHEFTGHEKGSVLSSNELRVLLFDSLQFQLTSTDDKEGNEDQEQSQEEKQKFVIYSIDKISFQSQNSGSLGAFTKFIFFIGILVSAYAVYYYELIQKLIIRIRNFFSSN